ncbi:MAG: DUF4145 domain-containing protein [Gammaproteobacteria bacterium]
MRIKTSFVCGWCGVHASGNRRWNLQVELAITSFSSDRDYHLGFEGIDSPSLHRCANCGGHSLFSSISLTSPLQQFPAPSMAESVEGLGERVQAIYTEAGRCMGVGAYSATVMLCRTLLMHIAIDKAEQSQHELDDRRAFTEYVKYLEKHNYLTPHLAQWADRVRLIGNDAVHKLPEIPRKKAEQMLAFITLLLRVIFEVPAENQKWQKGDDVQEAESHDDDEEI